MNNIPTIGSRGATASTEYNLCAAIWHHDGKKHVHQPRNINSGYVMCGRRHHNIISLNYELTGKKTVGRDCIQGFITNTNRFVTRIEALKVAVKSGQIEGIVSSSLYSEDLY